MFLSVKPANVYFVSTLIIERAVDFLIEKFKVSLDVIFKAYSMAEYHVRNPYFSVKV